MSIGVSSSGAGVQSRQSQSSGVDIAVGGTFDFASRRYAELYEASDATAFQHPIWLDRFFMQLAPARNGEAVILTGSDGNTGRLEFVLPLIRRSMSGVVLLEAPDLGVSDYAHPVVRRNFRCAGSIRDEIAKSLPRFDILRIRPVREESVAAWQFFLDTTTRQLDFSAHAAKLSAPFEAWRDANLDPSFHRYLDRKVKRFHMQKGAAFRRLTEPAEIEAAMAAMRSLRTGRFEGDMIQDDASFRFYAAVAVAGAPGGFARCYALSLAGADIGYAFGITANDRMNCLLFGCDHARHGRHSPRLILYDGMIADWIAAGGKVFDFGIGDEAFKADFATKPTAIFELNQTPTWRGTVARALHYARRRWREQKRTDGSEGGNRQDIQ